MLRLVEKGFEKYGKMLRTEKFVRTRDKKFIKLEQVITGLIYVVTSVAKKSEIKTMIRALQEIADATNREPLPLACLKGLRLQIGRIHKVSRERIKIVYKAKSIPAFRTVIIEKG